jgi:hypothetical protein
MTSYDRNAAESTEGALSQTRFSGVLLWAGTFALAFVLLVAVLMTLGPPTLPEGAFPP